MKMFSIRDIKSEGYNVPFFQPTFGLAERAYQNLKSDPQSQISKTPEDFSLCYIGEFDPKTGQFSPEPTPKIIGNA